MVKPGSSPAVPEQRVHGRLQPTSGMDKRSRVLGRKTKHKKFSWKKTQTQIWRNRTPAGAGPSVPASAHVLRGSEARSATSLAAPVDAQDGLFWLRFNRTPLVSPPKRKLFQLFPENSTTPPAGQCEAAKNTDGRERGDEGGIGCEGRQGPGGGGAEGVDPSPSIHLHFLHLSHQ